VFDASTFAQLNQVTRSSSVFPAQTFGLALADTNPSGGVAVGNFTVAMTVDFGQRQTRGTIDLDLGAAFPRAGRQTFQVSTQYTADGSPRSGPNDPAIQQVRTGSLGGAGDLAFHYVPINHNGTTADRLLSGVVFSQQPAGQPKVTGFGAGVSTTSGTPVAADVQAAIKTLKLPPTK
jgi:hypothetical protein